MKRKQKYVKGGGIEYPAKYAKKGNTEQKKLMGIEISKFKSSKGNEAYHLWSGDSVEGDKKTRYKTKESKYTKKFRNMFKK